MPRASFLLPIRNAEHTLADALESCLAQTERDFEVIAVLNGCTDGSAEIVRRFSLRDSRVKALESPAGDGLVGALNTGWRAAVSPVIARMDADDRCHPERLARQLARLEDEPGLDVVSCGVASAGDAGEGMRRYVSWVNSLETPEEISSGRFIESPVIHPAAAIRRQALERLGGYRDAGWAEDHDLWLRLLESGSRIGPLKDVLLEWTDHPQRLTRTDARYASDRVWRMKAHFLARLPVARERGVAVAGAGPIGKSLAKLLRAEGCEVHGFFDVSPRRIGQKIHGLPVVDATRIGHEWTGAAVISAVGVPGGREQVRGVARAAGMGEGENFWCAC